jgi:hypothetical protein
MTPGEIYKFTITMYPTSNVFRKGHRIRVDVSSSNYPRFDVNPNTGEPLGENRRMEKATNTIHLDAAHPSHITLPVIPSNSRSDAAMASEPIQQQRMSILSGVVDTLLTDLQTGTGDKDRRRQIEEWMRTLAEKYPEFKIEIGLRDYYLAEAERLREDFDKSAELSEKLNLGRSIESFLDRAAEYDRRIGER